MTPRLLDLFCGAGGCSVGYARAGFDVTGVDIEPHPDYPYRFRLADAMDVLRDRDYLSSFDVVHASPPCQLHTRAGHLRDAQGGKPSAVDLLTPTLAALEAWRGVWVVENVPGAPFGAHPVATVCGSSFGLRVRRHRLFASNVMLWSSVCDHARQGRPVGVYHVPGDDIPNGGRTARDLADGQDAMGVDWMTWKDLKEAIPPAYTEFLGGQLLTHLAAAVTP